jgi:hypothetical protein
MQIHFTGGVTTNVYVNGMDNASAIFGFSRDAGFCVQA